MVRVAGPVEAEAVQLGLSTAENIQHSIRRVGPDTFGIDCTVHVDRGRRGWPIVKCQIDVAQIQAILERKNGVHQQAHVYI